MSCQELVWTNSLPFCALQLVSMPLVSVTRIARRETGSNTEMMHPRCLCRVICVCDDNLYQCCATRHDRTCPCAQGLVRDCRINYNCKRAESSCDISKGAKVRLFLSVVWCTSNVIVPPHFASLLSGPTCA
jgi:hypothetical protein